MITMRMPGSANSISTPNESSTALGSSTPTTVIPR